MICPAHKPTPLSALPTGREGLDQSAHWGYKLKDINSRIKNSFFIT